MLLEILAKLNELIEAAHRREVADAAKYRKALDTIILRVIAGEYFDPAAVCDEVKAIAEAALGEEGASDGK